MPKGYIEHNHLSEDSKADIPLQSAGVKTSRKQRYKLENLLDEMPAELPRVDGWDEMKPIGKEMIE